MNLSEIKEVYKHILSEYDYRALDALDPSINYNVQNIIDFNDFLKVCTNRDYVYISNIEGSMIQTTGTYLRSTPINTGEIEIGKARHEFIDGVSHFKLEKKCAIKNINVLNIILVEKITKSLQNVLCVDRTLYFYFK